MSDDMKLAAQRAMVLTMVPGGVKYNDHCVLSPASWDKTYYDSRGQY